MKPHHYVEYAKVFDYFSDPQLFPELQKFIQRLARYLPDEAKVTDVGAGTGLYSAKLLTEKPDVRLSLIEPSSDMMAIASKRLGVRAKCYLTTVEQVLPNLVKQDAFIFQRSLYAIYADRTRYQQLFFKLNKKLKRKGYVFIYELKAETDSEITEEALENTKQYIGQFKETIQERMEFLAKWEVFYRMAKEMYYGINRGDFTLFTSEELDELLKTAGFSKVFEEHHVRIYRKEKLLNFWRRWWHFCVK